jgi:cysteine desulfuration protein SufE
LTPALQEVIDELRDADRQDRIDLLIDLARNLPPLPDHLAHLKDEAHRVPECMSPVFLFVEQEGDRFRLFADVPQEAPTVRGFVAILLEGLDGATFDEIQAVPADLVQRAGLLEILGMQRVSGLGGVLRRVKTAVARLAA